MKKYVEKIGPILILIAVSGALAPVYRAQISSATRVTCIPDGVEFFVDGKQYFHAMSAMWPPGSAHVLAVNTPVQDYVLPKTRYTFQGWEATGAAVQGNPISITASPYITEYRAAFSTQYAITFRFNVCPLGGLCEGNGAIQLGDGGALISTDGDFYFPAGSVVRLIAVPGDGYVFAGWQTAPGQKAVGLLNSVVLSGPITLYPRFVKARSMSFATVPSDLDLLIDRTQIKTPWGYQWGWGSDHMVDVISPQQDSGGRTWVFQAWNDGGASQHVYHVSELSDPVTLTATFARGIGVSLVTSPFNLSLSVDGKNAPPPYYFWWIAGDKHHVEAPAQQTDEKGRVWAFAGWGDGVATAARDITVPGQDLWLTANYQAVGHLTINSAVSGLTVKVDGADCAVPCEIQRPAGTKVRVSAPAALPLAEGVRADFAGWTGSGPSGAGDWVAALDGEPQAIWATYRTMNRLSAAADPEGGASWTLNPSSPDGYYDSQTTVTLGVTAVPGYRFRRWMGDASGADSVASVRMDAPRIVRALLDRAPYIAPAGVVSGAGVTPASGVAPGSVITVFGAGMSSDTVVGPDSPLAQTLAGVTARVGDRILPLFFVSPGQINMQLPTDLAPGRQTLTISSEGAQDATADFVVVRNAPGLFQQTVGERTIALVFHEDGTVVTPDSPARRGELLTLYGTGFGPLDPARLEGLAVPKTPRFQVTDAVSVVAGGAVITAEAAFAAPGRVGLDVAQFRLSGDVPDAAAVPLTVRIAGQESNTVQLPIEQL